MNEKSILFNVDSYKVSMGSGSDTGQYPPGTEYVYSYIESRGGKYDETVMFGLQAFIRDYMMEPVTTEDINEAELFYKLHGEPFDRTQWDYIVKEHNGFLPLRIDAVPEGTVVPYKNVLATVINTDPKCYWLTTWVETAILRAVWYGTTVCTRSWTIKQIIKKFLEETGTPEAIDFALNDFGSRGVSSFESSGIAGAAHLVNFKGSDNVAGIRYAMKHYDSGVCGFSVPAAEHSTITSWGRDKEALAYANMIKRFAKPGSIVAVVSDSYDIFHAADFIWGQQLRQQVIDSGATVVVRPDSGDPVAVNLKLIEILGGRFGYTFNDKGFRVLKNVRLIQGDGVTELSITSILGAFKALGWSADNIVFGCGGYLLQDLNRDTQKFAMKCSAIRVNGEWRNVQKDPITDQGKRSKVGLVKLWKCGSEFESSVDRPTRWVDNGFEWESALKPVYSLDSDESGTYVVAPFDKFDDIKARANT